MLGRFLELSVATDDIRASVEFYERLGFSYDRPKGLRNCVMVRTVDPA